VLHLYEEGKLKLNDRVFGTKGLYAISIKQQYLIGCWPYIILSSKYVIPLNETHIKVCAQIINCDSNNKNILFFECSLLCYYLDYI